MSMISSGAGPLLQRASAMPATKRCRRVRWNGVLRVRLRAARFIKLGTEAGGRFIREVFPVYYVAMCAVSLVAAALLAFASAARGADALAMACIGIVFFLARFALLPIINRNRDAGQAGVLGAKKRFDLLHRVSVIVNLVQMLAVLVVLVRYAAY